MPSRLVARGFGLIVFSSAALAEGPGLGRLAAPDEIASWDISIGPDGAGLPPGRGTPKQGRDGLRRQNASPATARRGPASPTTSSSADAAA